MIDIDFSGRSPSRPLGWTLAVCGLLVLAWQGWALWRAEELVEARASTATAARVAARTAPPSTAPAPTPASARMALASQRQIDQIAADLAAPWGDLLQVFEARAGRQVTLLRMEPDAHSGLVRLAGEARTLSAVLAYVSALDTDPMLRQVLLTHHQTRSDPAVTASDAGASTSNASANAVVSAPMVEFTLTAAWRPAEQARTRSEGTR
jgi:hypothetical protein